MSSVPYITIMLFMFQAIICSRQDKCAVLEFYHLQDDALSIEENQYVNITFGMNLSACNQSNTMYMITVRTRTNDGSLEYDGNVIFHQGLCYATQKKSVRCTTLTGLAELYRKVNRTHKEILWEWMGKDSLLNGYLFMPRKLKLIVAYPPSVKNLAVDGHEVDGNYLIEEGQKVNISCSYDQGTLSANFRLSDENGREIKSYRDEQNLHASFTGHCNQDWSSVRCEGNSSENIRSVFFLVRCPPQLIDKSPKVTDYETHEGWMFRIKAHSTAIQKCLLAPSVVGENKNKEVSCTLTGSPPSLLLTIFVDKDECSQSGNWALTVFNEKGPSDMLVFSISSHKPKATNLTVDGHEVNGDHVISEGQKVTVVCSFDNGNPPVPFHLLDKIGRELRSSNKGHVSYSFAIKCEDDWPVIRCEGAGSDFNRSVSFLVRCPLQFLENSTAVIYSQALDFQTFRVKSHTATANGCFLIPLSSDDNTIEEVNCTLHGNKPDLVLSLDLRNESQIHGNWTLILRSESGSTNTTLRFIKSPNQNDKQPLPGYSNLSFR